MKKLLEKYLDKKDVDLIWNEIQKLEIEMPHMEEGVTVGQWNISLPYVLQEYRPTDALSYVKIEEMLKSGPVRFALEMKRAAMVSSFRNKHSIKIECADEELRAVAEKALEEILPFMAFEFTWSSLVYGSAFMELVWTNKTTYELGVSKNPSSTYYTVPKVPNLVPHKTVSYILRTEKGHFDGFVQNPDVGFIAPAMINRTPNLILSPRDIYVPPESSLVIPYNGFSRNLWGESFLTAIYPLWFWYEIIVRCLVSFSELMGDPPRIGRAPSKKKVRVSADKLENAIDHLLYLSTNLPNTNSIVIPSDTDENGKYEWELQYMSIPDRSQPFTQILELLNQMILRAAISGDPSPQSSEVVGELNAQSTSLHNEMVVTSWVHYLNQYFVKHFSLYNRGESGPPIRLEIQGLDQRERDFLEKIMNIAGNSATFQEWFYMVDWETLAKMAGLPVLNKEQADALKKKLQQESLDRQEAQLKMAKTYETPNAPKEGGESNEARKLEEVVSDLIDRRLMILTDAEVDRITLRSKGYNPYRGKGGKFTTGGGFKGDYKEMDSYVGDNGSFYRVDDLVNVAASKPTVELKVEGLIYKSEMDELNVDRVVKADYGIPIIVRENGIVLDGAHRVQKAINEGKKTIPAKVLTDEDLVTIKLQAPVKLVSADQFDENKVKRDTGGRFAKKASPKITLLDSLLDQANKLTNPDAKQRALEMLNGINPSDITEEMYNQLNVAMSLFDLSKPYATADEALKDITSKLKEMGVVGLQDIKNIGMLSEEDMKREGLMGHYNEDTNTLEIHPDLLKGLQEGDPLAVGVLAHEILHSGQEVFRPLKEGETHMMTLPDGNVENPNTIFTSTDMKQQQEFAGMVEGQNELLTQAFLGKYYGTPYDPKIAQLHNYLKTGDKSGVVAYAWETHIYADYLMAASKKTGANPVSLLIQQHDKGMDMQAMSDFIKTSGGILGAQDPNDNSFPDVGVDDIGAYDEFLKYTVGYTPIYTAPDIEVGGPS